MHPFCAPATKPLVTLPPSLQMVQGARSCAGSPPTNILRYCRAGSGEEDPAGTSGGVK
jgi:hypothetical protein